MFENLRIEKNLWGWRWPLIAVVALLALLGIQIIRVNQPRTAANVEKIEYSSPGPLVPGEVVVPAESYYANRINLNRRGKIYGSFRTGNVHRRIDVLVLDDANFEKWKVGSEFIGVIQTGYVPGGKISPVVGPGIYYLVFDGRRNPAPQTVQSDIALE
jgi:hypothetical protein